MKTNKIISAVILLSIFVLSGCNIFYDNNNGEFTGLYKSGIESLNKGDTTQAGNYFKQSIRKYNDAPSLYELSEIYLKENTFHSRSLAYENLRNAVFIQPENLKYRFAYADLMREMARASSFGQYKKILEIDSTQFRAWLSLAELKDEDFTEYNRSGRQLSDVFFGSLQEYANEDFDESEKYYLKVIEYDSLNYGANLKLALLYEKAGKSGKGIQYLQNLINSKKDDKDHSNIFSRILH